MSADMKSITCPACGAVPDADCYTPINGIDTGWTHDDRLFAYMGVRGA